MKMTILDMIGYQGPIIMILANLWILRNRLFRAFLFIIYILLNYFITIQLKMAIKEPRPHGYNSEINQEWMHPLDYVGFEQYGMPSGHSLLVSFSLFYLWWNTRNPWYMIGGSFIAALTMYQRFKYKKHSISQLIVGFVLGIVFSYVSYTYIDRVFI